MIKQYTDNYSSISADIQNIVANDVSLLEDYVLMQTGQYEWTALINTRLINKCRYIRITRSSGSSYNNHYTVSRGEYSGKFGASVSNEYYTYSNVGVGRSLNLPIHDTAVSYSIVFIACLVAFAVVFKGVLFKCLKRRK